MNNIIWLCFSTFSARSGFNKKNGLIWHDQSPEPVQCSLQSLDHTQKCPLCLWKRLLRQRGWRLTDFVFVCRKLMSFGSLWMFIVPGITPKLRRATSRLLRACRANIGFPKKSIGGLVIKVNKYSPPQSYFRSCAPQAPAVGFSFIFFVVVIFFFVLQ